LVAEFTLVEICTVLFLMLSSIFQDPIKVILFSGGIPVCHAFDPDAKDGHDLLIGMNTGDGVYNYPGHKLKLLILMSLWVKLTIRYKCSFLSSIFCITKAAAARPWEEAYWANALQQRWVNK
jgi:hypothetical protein